MLGQVTLFLISNNLKLLKFRLQSRIVGQHEYNSFSLLRFPRGEGVKKKVNNELLVNRHICNLNMEEFSFNKYSTVLRGTSYPEKTCFHVQNM